MFLKDLRLSARLGKAHGLVLKERYLEAAKLIRSIIEVDQDHYLVPLLHEDLGICLYHLGEYSESYEIMTNLVGRLLTESVKGEFELDLESLARITWYIRAGEKAMGMPSKALLATHGRSRQSTTLEVQDGKNRNCRRSLRSIHKGS